MAPARLLNRNLRPLKFSQEDVKDIEGIGGDDAETPLPDDNYNHEVEEDTEDEEDSVDPVEPEFGPRDDAVEGESDVEQQLSNVSFKALREAQDVLSRKRKLGSDITPDHESKLEALRARLRKIKNEKANAQRKSAIKTETKVSQPAKAIHATDDDDDKFSNAEDSGSAPSEDEASTKARGSKHAPATRSSKHQVTRKRAVIDVPKRMVRDPRFDALHQRSMHAGNSEKAYSFIRDYQKAEMDELKAAIKRTEDVDDKAKLKRTLVSMENRLKSKEAKEREQDVLRRHRVDEREKIQQGKQPFYLKKKELKERALVEKFKGMKGKEREKLLEKRRRKDSQREKRRMPEVRRLAG